MFIATVSYGLAVSVPCGEDAERAVNSTGPGEKGSVLLPGSTWGPGNGRGDTPGLLPVLSHTLVGHSPRMSHMRDALEVALVRPCFVPAESVRVRRAIPARKQRSCLCKIFPALSQENQRPCHKA